MHWNEAGKRFLEWTRRAFFRAASGPGYSDGHMPFVARQGRIDLQVPVILGLGGALVTAETRNIGLGGVFVATRETSPVGQRFPIRLALPDWDETHFVTAEVRWVPGPDSGAHSSGGRGMGVKFVKLSLHVAAVLHGFVRLHTLLR